MMMPFASALSASVKFLTGNKLINAAIIAWTLAQILKVVIDLIRFKSLDFSRLVGSGGMPSSHSACVCAVAAAAGKLCGMGSVDFAIAATFAFIVMFDAFNVRRAAGEQAKILNFIMNNWDKMTPDLFGKELKELLGHTPIQVFVGAFLGIAVGLIM